MLIQEMSKSDCFDILAQARFGRLSCAHENQPYVVPFYFVYHDPFLYGFTTLGQKVEWMRSNPLVCVELDNVEGSDQWTSIVIVGKYEELPDTREGKQERLHAHALLQQHPEWWQPGCASCTHRNPEQAVAPVFYRIRIDRISGRRAMPSPDEPVGPGTHFPARNSQG
jgi:nitroimidazol reductase NimA-like FMN-containing flavoprotein (pyridoxamine 5'-phosphate oxidase superfamily)